MAYARYAEAALKVWRVRARMLEDDRAGISALVWRQNYERAEQQRLDMRAAMSVPQLNMMRARQLLATVPELTADVGAVHQIAELVDLCLNRGRTLTRYAALHPEAVAELTELGFDTEEEESDEETAEVADEDEL